VLAAQWSAIGINAKPRATEYGVWLDLRVKSYDYFISTNLSFPAFDSAGYLYNTYLTGSGPATWDNWSDPMTDSLLKKLEATVKPADQQALLATIEKRLVTQCASWWTYAQTNVEVAQLNVKGLNPHPSQLPLSLDGVWLAK
jgi:ABC-type transport system substrate-binding protein